MIWTRREMLGSSLGTIAGALWPDGAISPGESPQFGNEIGPTYVPDWNATGLITGYTTNPGFYELNEYADFVTVPYHTHTPTDLSGVWENVSPNKNPLTQGELKKLKTGWALFADGSKVCLECRDARLPKPTIAELEKLLERDEDVEIEILPNGEVRAKGTTKDGPKPLTLRENLGGEYAAA